MQGPWREYLWAYRRGIFTGANDLAPDSTFTARDIMALVADA